MALSLSATLLSLTSFFSSARPWGQISLDFQLFYFQKYVFDFNLLPCCYIQPFKFNEKYYQLER